MKKHAPTLEELMALHHRLRTEYNMLQMDKTELANSLGRDHKITKAAEAARSELVIYTSGHLEVEGCRRFGSDVWHRARLAYWREHGSPADRAEELRNLLGGSK